MEIDTRFLTIHPRTALWFKEREQCRACLHHSLIPPDGEHRGHGERCAKGSRRWNDWTCIGMRDEGSRCGPDAKLFTPKEKPE